MSAALRLGQLYRCPVCGAEVVVINAASGELDPHCCNVPMEPLRLAAVYRCEVCGSEMVVLRGDGGPLELHCCNQPMAPRAGTVGPEG